MSTNKGSGDHKGAPQTQMPALRWKAGGAPLPDTVIDAWLELALKRKQPGGSPFFGLYLDQWSPTTSRHLPVERPSRNEGLEPSPALLRTLLSFRDRGATLIQAHVRLIAQGIIDSRQKRPQDWTIVQHGDLGTSRSGTELNFDPRSTWNLPLWSLATPARLGNERIVQPDAAVCSWIIRGNIVNDLECDELLMLTQGMR